MKKQPRLQDVQRLMASAIMRPLDADFAMRTSAPNGGSMRKLAESIIAPGKTLSSFERLEIYNQQYWYRLLDCMYDDFPGLLSVLGDKKFRCLTEAYLQQHPPDSYALSHIGKDLPAFLDERPDLAGRSCKLARQMAAFEWAQIAAFDAEHKRVISVADIDSTPPAKLLLGVQPHVQLLLLDYALDEFDIALKKIPHGSSEAGIAHSGRATVRSARPARRRVYLAVHRFRNDIYYKRLEPVAFVVLLALRDGASLFQAIRAACDALPRASIDHLNDDLQFWFAEFSRLGWLCKR